MTHYARIEGREVKEVREFDSIEGRFHESLTWVECPESVNQGHLYDSDTGEFTEPTTTTLTLSEAKSDKIKEIKNRAYKVLSETDWYVVREQETGEAIPQDALDHRSQVRSDSDRFEQEVNNLTTVEEVFNYEYSFPEPPES